MRQGNASARITGNKRYFIWVGIGIIFMFVAIATWRLTSSSYASEEAVVLTIDRIEVTKREFELFLQNNKALTTSYFKRKYNVDYSDDFWTSSYNGENPLAYAKQKAMEELQKYKVKQILMKEHGIISDLSFNTFLKQFNSENEQRQEKLRNAQPIYGPKQYGEREYYSYMQSMNYQQWIDQLTKEALNSLSDEKLQLMYEDMKQALFHRGYSYVYEKISLPSSSEAQSLLEQLKQLSSVSKQSTEEAVQKLNTAQAIHVERLSLDLDDKSKDDEFAQNLNIVLMGMKPGEFTAMDTSGEDTVMYKLLAAKDKGYEPYEKVRTAVVQMVVQKQVELQISQRLSKAVIEIHQEVLNRISFT